VGIERLWEGEVLNVVVWRSRLSAYYVVADGLLYLGFHCFRAEVASVHSCQRIDSIPLLWILSFDAA